MIKGFTLVIPLYNKVNAIRTTLDSVLKNHGTYPFKCIIVDDDSTDGSSEIAEEYDTKHPDIFMYIKRKHHERKTPIYARNLGIKLTETEYIGFLDADDELCEGFIDRGCKFLDDHPEYSLYGNGNLIHKDIQSDVLNYNSYFDFYKRNSAPITTFLTLILNGGFDVHWCANIYKTELVKQNLFIDCYAEDAVFKLKYMFKNEPFYIDDRFCESIKWNVFNRESTEWNTPKTDKSNVEEIFDTIQKEIPNFNYTIKCDVGNNFVVYVK